MEKDQEEVYDLGMTLDALQEYLDVDAMGQQFSFTLISKNTITASASRRSCRSAKKCLFRSLNLTGVTCTCGGLLVIKVELATNRSSFQNSAHYQ